MKLNKINIIAFSCFVNAFIITPSCTKLDTKVYDRVLNDNFWDTPDQIASGIAPIYTQLRDGLGWGGSDFYELNGVSTDEIIVPIRGGDWADGGMHQRIFFHQWTAEDGNLNSVWNYVFGGIGRCNFILEQVNNLPEKPSTIEEINAEVKTLRAYFYLMAIDLFGNVPIVNSFKIDPSTIKNNTRSEVFDFIEKDLLESIPKLNSEIGPSTYGRANKWTGYAILAKLYLNAQVYTGKARWADCAKACEEIISKGGYSLEPTYFDNFKYDNDYSNRENIFVAPFDNKYIGGQSKEQYILHYNLGSTFGLSSGGYNGWSSHGDYYYQNFDTVSTYTTNANRILRTFKDQRTGQFLVGQQFQVQYPYPQDKNVLISSSKADSLFDGENIPLYLQPNFTTFEFPQIAGGTALTTGKLVGARNIKYFPQAGVDLGNQSNDLVLLRLADIILMRAECIMRDPSIANSSVAVDLVNQVRLRAYSGDESKKWTIANLTPANLLKERAAEMSYEGFRRQDLIRFDVADGTNYFGGQRGGVRSPNKPADPGNHLRLFPIPKLQHTANNNLAQNPGYPAF